MQAVGGRTADGEPRDQRPERSLRARAGEDADGARLAALPVGRGVGVQVSGAPYGVTSRSSGRLRMNSSTSGTTASAARCDQERGLPPARVLDELRDEREEHELRRSRHLR